MSSTNLVDFCPESVFHPLLYLLEGLVSFHQVKMC